MQQIFVFGGIELTVIIFELSSLVSLGKKQQFSTILSNDVPVLIQHKYSLLLKTESLYTAIQGI